MWCWFFRRMVSHAADSDQAPGPLTMQHLSRCRDCSRFSETCRLLAEGLRREASDLKDGTEQSGRPSRPVIPRGPAIARVGVAAIIALAVFAGVYLAARSPQPETHSPMGQIVGGTTNAFENTWEPLTMNPLAGEIENLVSDAESGVDFVLACLDVSPIVGDPAGQTE